MRGKAGGSIAVSALLVIVALSLGLLWLSPLTDGEVTAEDIQDALGSGANHNDSDSMREQAYELATILFDDPAQCNKFAGELVDIYFEAKDMDFLLIYNTGGFGGGTMAEDPEWPSILEGIKEELAELGYKSIIVEHERGKGGVFGFIGEVDELMEYYSTKTPELAAKIAFLTRYNPDLKVIVTGRCFGAIISNEVMELEAANTRLYSIQAGVPFWYTGPSGERTLVVENNGIMPDTLGRGDFLAAVRANLTRLPSTSPIEEGSVRILDWYFKMPGHTYTWEHLGVQSQITSFLKENFDRKN
jgi:hypothetical protein